MFRLFVLFLMAASLATAPGIASTAADCQMAEMPAIAAQDMADHSPDQNDEMECCSTQCDFACSASVFWVRSGWKCADYVASSPVTIVVRDMLKSTDSDGLDPPPRA